MSGVTGVWKAAMPNQQHSGIMIPTGEVYPEMEEVIQDVSGRLYQIATGDQGR
jgi:hypothetical protein